jgi:glycosyltransferase involved in cell wall biosynthesis
MRILSAIVAPPHLSVSGAARAAERLNIALAGACDVTVASMMPASTWQCPASHVPVRTSLPACLRLPPLPNAVRTPFYRSDIPARIRPGRYDLVHIHNPMPALEMARIGAACRRAGVPYVVSTHGFQEIDAGRMIYGFGPVRRALWDRLVYRAVVDTTAAADAVLLLSEEDRRVVRRMGYTGSDLFVVPNGTEQPRTPRTTATASTLKKFDIQQRAPGQLVCMFLANHTRNKGLPILFEAFASLDIPYLLIVGGDRRTGVDYAGFEASLRKEQRVIFTGSLRDDEVNVLMRRSDLFVFPSLADTLPLAIQEALAVGLPVLASDVGGISRQIDDTCGVLVPPGDAPALASAVRRLSQDRDALDAMSRAAVRRFRQLPTWAECARYTAAAYRIVLERRSRRRRVGRMAPGAGSEPVVEVVR